MQSYGALVTLTVGAVALIFVRVQNEERAQVRRAIAARMLVRRAQDSDLVAFKQMWSDYCAFFGAESSLGGVVFEKMKKQEEMVIAEVDGRPVGFATFIVIPHTFGDAMYLEDLFVSKGVRNMGLGRVLLSHVADLTKKLGVKRLYWVRFLCFTNHLLPVALICSMRSNMRIAGFSMTRWPGSCLWFAIKWNFKHKLRVFKIKNKHAELPQYLNDTLDILQDVRV